jgi:hypothetical protein
MNIAAQTRKRYCGAEALGKAGGIIHTTDLQILEADPGDVSVNVFPPPAGSEG